MRVKVGAGISGVVGQAGLSCRDVRTRMKIDPRCGRDILLKFRSPG